MQDMEQRVQAYWTKRARDFSTVRRNELHNDAMGRRWLTEMQRYLPQGKTLDILDVGTGTGYFAILLAREGHRLTGIDLTPAMIAEAEATAAAMDAAFADASFDVIVTRNLTWTLPDTEQAYREWRRLLRPGGVLLNFDANYGDNVRHQRQKDSYIPATEVYGHCGITPELERENAAITLAMPISRQARPQWDMALLPRCGFSRCGCDEDAGRRILGDLDLADAPLFLITARR